MACMCILLVEVATASCSVASGAAAYHKSLGYIDALLCCVNYGYGVVVGVYLGLHNSTAGGRCNKLLPLIVECCDCSCQAETTC